ncbi:MAG TPA: nicotinate phosphoribosyltransferase [Actinomycetota bacterium]|jgi:nicotinate phosphoribosyltransferase|nr:nicotinate phosphoribosyltransferase [Actinomycetota bacterium]
MALGLFTDLYEVRMVESYLRRGMTARATFSLYIRAMPQRPWFVALGVGKVLEALASFRYGPDEIAYLRGAGVGEPTLDWLGAFAPSGEIWAVAEGEIVLANEPILEVTASLPAAQLLETAMINLVQYPTLVATKAAMIASAAEGRSVVDFGFRRAHGLETGVEAARAAYVGGGLTTSNLEAGRRYGIPVVGTMAHSYVQAHSREVDAFRAFAEDHPDNAIFLVDTYDTIEGTRRAITVAGEMQERGARLRGIRIDSGDLLDLSKRARAMLDDAGLAGVQILASGGLDEKKIEALVSSGAPIDAFGVGTELVTSADRPSLDVAYKLVSYDGRPTAKLSPEKATLPGEKQVFRSEDGDVIGLRSERLPGRPLLEPVWRDGTGLKPFDLETSRAYAAEGLARASSLGAPALSAAMRDLVSAVPGSD